MRIRLFFYENAKRRTLRKGKADMRKEISKSVVYFSGGFCFCGLNICVFLPDFTKEFCDIRYMLYSNGGCDIHGKYADFSLAFLVSALSSEEESLCCFL